jgi:PadR family transcriptional regulator PadR
MDEIEQLLARWEESYKKGLLTFWALLLLDERPMYALEMSELIAAASRGTIVADDNSIYRAMRRFEDMGLVSSTWEDSSAGPQRRYYELTDLGRELLALFIRRNVMLFQEPAVSARIRAVLDPHKGEAE